MSEEDPFVIPKSETAIDLTEQERTSLYTAASHLLKERGKIQYPDPNVQHYNEEGELYQPAPTLLAEVFTDELQPYALPYDTLSVQTDELEFGGGGPARLVIYTSRMATGTIPSADGDPGQFGFGLGQQFVAMAHDDELGIVIEDEDSEIELQTGDPAEKERYLSMDTGNYVTLVGVPTMCVDGPILSRQDLTEVTSAIARLVAHDI